MERLVDSPIVPRHSKEDFAVFPWGRFCRESEEFILTTPFAPRPWKNILWNERYNAQPTQVSGGISYQRDDTGRIILLNWSDEKYLYLQNRKTGEAFCPSFSPLNNRKIDSYEHRIGLYYSHTVIEQLGLRVNVTQSVDRNLPQEYFEISLENLTEEAQAWRLVFFADLNLQTGDSKFSSSSRFVGNSTQDGCRISVCNQADTEGQHTAFLESLKPFDGTAMNKADFTGVFGSLARPDALSEGWPSRHSPISSAILAGYLDFDLDEGGAASALFTLGLTNGLNKDWANKKLTTPDDVASSKERQRERFQQAYDGLSVQTPDDEFDLFVNTWIKHQLTYCAYWNRGWAKGFRDSNQDAWAYLLLDPARSKEMILSCLPYQFSDGRTVRKWDPVDRDAYNDGGTWLIFATHAYLAETGDYAVLEHSTPFFESDEKGTLYEHLSRCIDYLWANRGDRGMCLMPFGDWNDRLTGVGKGGKGQSVWTTMALLESLRQMACIARRVGRSDDQVEFSEKAETLRAILRKEAWNGQWYSRAFADDGSPVGAPECSEGTIFLLPQAWSIIAGVATPDQVSALLSVVDEKLRTVHGYRLLTPPYQAYDPRIGHLSSTQPGMLENGGNYCHGSMFMAYALSMAGQRERSYEVLKSIFPTNPENPSSVSEQEPYSLTNSYCTPESGALSGRSYFSWRTGTAGWALRTAIEGVMGVVATSDGLVIKGDLPCPSWGHASLKRTIRGKTLHIQWQKTGTPSRTLNGIPIDEEPLQPEDWTQTENHLLITF